MPGRLRYFLYRDDRILTQFLEQLEGGVYDEERIHQQASGGGSIGVGVNAGPLRGNASRDRSSSSESELNLRQTGSSRFSRFYELAVTGGELQQLDGCDDAIWDQLQIGEILDIGVSLSIPEIVKSLGMVGRVTALMPLFQTLGGFEDDDGSPLINTRDMAMVTNRLPVFEQAATAMEEAGVPLLASLVGDTRFKMFLRLKKTSLQIEELQEFDGDARLVGSIQSKVAKGKPTEVGQLLPGLRAPNRAQRRQGGAEDKNSVTMRYPAAIINPIAIFR